MIIKRKPLKFTSRVGIVFENPVIRRKEGSRPLSKFGTEISEGKVRWDDGGGGGS